MTTANATPGASQTIASGLPVPLSPPAPAGFNLAEILKISGTQGGVLAAILYAAWLMFSDLRGSVREDLNVLVRESQSNKVLIQDLTKSIDRMTHELRLTRKTLEPWAGKEGQE
jgi:hypothetical protein